jgi:tetratricopeptide (TPR) repeat protein
VKQKELEGLAARMVGGPRDPDLYVRALEAAAVARRGLELLHEVAEILEDLHPVMRPVADSTQVLLFRPGDRLLDRDGEEAWTDLLDEAAEQVRFALAAGSANDMADVLGGMTEVGLRKTVAGSIAELLETLPSGDLARLKDVVERWSTPAVGTSLISRVANAMLPEAEGGRGDRLRFAGDRLRDATALLKVGREMLHEVAELLPPVSESDPTRAVEPQSFTPGAWVRLGDVSVPTDPLELLGYEVAALVASEAAKLDQLDELLTALTRSLDEDGRPVGVLETHLTPDTASELAVVLGVPETDREGSTAPSRSSTKRPVNLGQLRRALLKAPERYPTIGDAWQTLISERLSFARRWAAGVHLCRMTRELVRTDPAAAAAWAAQVGKAAEGLATPGGFEGRMADFLGLLASAHVGNALRVQGNFLVAERFFLPWEEDDHLGLRAECLALKATLRRVQRRPAEAITLFEEADSIARQGGFPGARDLTAQIRIAHAHALEMMSEFAGAAALAQAALGIRVPSLPESAVIPPGELSPRFRWIALQNLAHHLSKAGDLEGAERVLAELDALGKALTLPETDLLRTRWVRARIDVRKAWHAGADTLRVVRERFLELGLIFDAALASLELAEWHAEEIRGAETDEEHLAAIRELAMESAAFFAGQDVGPEAIAAIALFGYVSSVTTPTASTIRKIERLLRQAAIS